MKIHVSNQQHEAAEGGQAESSAGQENVKAHSEGVLEERRDLQRRKDADFDQELLQMQSREMRSLGEALECSRIANGMCWGQIMELRRSLRREFFQGALAEKDRAKNADHYEAMLKGNRAVIEELQARLSDSAINSGRAVSSGELAGGAGLVVPGAANSMGGGSAPRGRITEEQVMVVKLHHLSTMAREIVDLVERAAARRDSPGAPTPARSA